MLSRINQVLKRIGGVLANIVLTFDAIAMAAIVLIIFAQVISRYVFNRSLTWSEELSKFITVWIIFLTTGYVLFAKQHVSMDLFFGLISKRAQFYISKVFCAIYIFFCYVMIKNGFTFYKLGLGVSASSFDFPLNYIYLIVPISGFLMLFYTAILLFERKEGYL